LPAAEEGWLPELPLPVTATLLHDGVRLVAGSRTLELNPAPAVPLRQDYRLGCWTSTAQLTPMEPHWLLVADSKGAEVRSYLHRCAQPGWRELRGVAPEGWFLVREVVVDTHLAAAPAGLERLAPAVGPRPALLGGLALAGSATYLQGGEPDLWVPPAAASAGPVEVSVDGAVHCLPSAGDRLDLRGLRLPAEISSKTVDEPLA
jgi:hypothetical protein